MIGIAIFFLFSVGFIIYIMVRPTHRSTFSRTASTRNSRERGFGND